jgi:hypothetical protein
MTPALWKVLILLGKRILNLPAAAEINMIIGCGIGKNLAFMENDSEFP